MYRNRWSNIVRGGLVVLLLGCLAAIVGNDLAPGVPTWEVVFYAVAAGTAVFAVILGATVASLQIGQYVLRKRGRDPQWFWFSSEPAGLVDLLEEDRTAARSATAPVEPAR